MYCSAAAIDSIRSAAWMVVGMVFGGKRKGLPSLSQTLFLWLLRAEVQPQAGEVAKCAGTTGRRNDAHSRGHAAADHVSRVARFAPAGTHHGRRGSPEHPQSALVTR